jgi:hypothetical protein
MTPRRFYCTLPKACHALFLVKVAGLTQTHAALYCGLNVGTVNHVVHGRRFPEAYPIAPPGFV